MNIKLQVTADHLKRGRAGDPNYCAVALALAAAFPGGRQFHVSGWGSISFYDQHNVYRSGWVSQDTIEKICIFDNPGRRHELEPFTATVILRRYEYDHANR